MKDRMTDNNRRELPEAPEKLPEFMMRAVLPDCNGGLMPCPELLTEHELVLFLRIPEISSSKDYHNVVEDMRRLRQLQRIHICNKTLYPKKAIEQWIGQEITTEK